MKMARRPLGLLFAGLVLAGLALAIWFGWWHRLREHRSERNYTLIETGLYMGGSVRHPPPETNAVLNLCEAEDPYTCEVHVWDKIPDAAPAPSIEWLRKQVQFVDSQRQAGRNVYVHCFGGVSRAGMVITAYFMFKNGWTRDQALEFVRSKRPIVKPNPAFMELLLEWERGLSRPAADQERPGNQRHATTKRRIVRAPRVARGYNPIISGSGRVRSGASL